MADILFAQPSRYGAFGRNGHTKAIGLAVVELNDEVQISPINSRGDVTRCRIPVPRAALPALIQELQRYV